MEQLKIQTIDCESIHIAAYLEAYTNNEHSIFQPSTIIFYMVEGQYNLTVGQKLYVFPERTFFLVRKYVHGSCFKSWSPHQSGAKLIAFSLHDEFLRQVISKWDKKEISASDVENEIVVQLPKTELLESLIQSIETHFSVNGKTELDRFQVEQKTEEALRAIIDADPGLFHVFHEFARPEKADLVDFMNHNFMYNLPLAQIAKLSGRSLSTFNREFRRIFSESPHRWIMKSRLELARNLLVQTTKTPSEIYMEVGFEDLSHFSKRFKAYFGKNPSELKHKGLAH